jgi:hypothetical protein
MYSSKEYETIRRNVSASDYITNKQQLVRYTQTVPFPNTFVTYEERNALMTQHARNNCKGPC